MIVAGHPVGPRAALAIVGTVQLAIAGWLLIDPDGSPLSAAAAAGHDPAVPMLAMAAGGRFAVCGAGVLAAARRATALPSPP